MPLERMGTAERESDSGSLTSFWGRMLIENFLVAPSQCVSTSYPTNASRTLGR